MIPLVKPYIAPREEMMPAVEKVLYSGYIAEGESVYRFEHDFGMFVGHRDVIALNSGTAALHIALLMSGVGAGDEVISTPMTSEPTNTTILLTGAKVVWADVEIETGLISPQSIESKITARTKAIMVVHYAGMVCDMDKIGALSSKYNIPVIEDAAHALGSEYAGEPVGSSKYICYSFQAIKHLTTVDGGALAIKDATEKEMSIARRLRWFGLDKKVARLDNDIHFPGFKYGMNNVNAEIGNVQLKYIKGVLSRHIENGRYYDQELAGADGVTLIPYHENTCPSYWIYTMKVKDRDSFICRMEAAGITASPLHHRSDTHSVFKEAKCSLPGMEHFYSEFVHIPCGWWVDEKTREKIIEAIKLGW